MASLFQFSIRGLLYAVTFLAVGIAALLNAGPLWQGLVWGLALYALVGAILLIVYRRQEKRAFWLGFAVFGWAYLLLFLLSQQSWVRLNPLRQRELLATQVAQWSHSNLLPESRRQEYVNIQIPQGDASGTSGPPPGMSMPGGGDMAMMGGSGGMPMVPGAGGPGGMMAGMMGGMGSPGFYQAPNPNYVPPQEFTNIFHALTLLLIAAVGGKTCQVICRTQQNREE